MHCDFRRGFIAAITCTATDCLAHLDAIRGVQPVTEVTLTSWPDIEGDSPLKLSGRFCLKGRKKMLPYHAFDDGRERLLAILSFEWDGIDFTLPEGDGSFVVPPHPSGALLDVLHSGASVVGTPIDL